MKSKEKEEEESRARALEEAEAIEAVIEEARVKALETMARGVSMEDGSYEGGTALAPCCMHGSVSWIRARRRHGPAQWSCNQ